MFGSRPIASARRRVGSGDDFPATVEGFYLFLQERERIRLRRSRGRTQNRPKRGGTARSVWLVDQTIPAPYNSLSIVAPFQSAKPAG